MNKLFGIAGMGAVLVILGFVAYKTLGVRSDMSTKRMEKVSAEPGGQSPKIAATPLVAPSNGTARAEKNQAEQIPYVSEAATQSLVGNRRALYFFKANWCSTCSGAQEDLDANLSRLPADLTIVTVDYDKETELKRKYGITSQHTWVQIDSQGKALAIWNGGDTDEILKNLR